jgi:integrase
MPGHRKHRQYPKKPHASGQARIRLNGKDVYLGPWGSPESRRRFHEIMADVTTGKAPTLKPKRAADPDARPVTWLVAGFLQGQVGRVTDSRLSGLKSAVRPLLSLYGDLPVRAFTPAHLVQVRRLMVQDGGKRRSVNQRVNDIRGVFSFGVMHGVYAAEMHARLKKVPPLRPGEDAVAESIARRSVPDAAVEAVRPHVAPQVWALITLQRFSAARPGELFSLTAADLDMSGEAWTVEVIDHKNAHRGHSRTLYFGPECQQVIRPFLADRPVNAPLFSPTEAADHQRAAKSAMRKTPAGQGNRPGYNSRTRAGEDAPLTRPARDCYDKDSYGRAVQRACERALPSPAADELEALAKAAKATQGGKLTDARRQVWVDRPDLAEADRAWRREHD